MAGGPTSHPPSLAPLPLRLPVSLGPVTLPSGPFCPGTRGRRCSDTGGAGGGATPRSRPGACQLHREQAPGCQVPPAWVCGTPVGHTPSEKVVKEERVPGNVPSQGSDRKLLAGLGRAGQGVADSPAQAGRCSNGGLCPQPAPPSVSVHPGEHAWDRRAPSPGSVTPRVLTLLTCNPPACCSRPRSASAPAVTSNAKKWLRCSQELRDPAPNSSSVLAQIDSYRNPPRCGRSWRHATLSSSSPAWPCPAQRSER